MMENTLIQDQKNKTLRVGIIVTILAIISFSLVSGSLAKYIQTLKGFNTTRVAKFEYTVTDQEETPLSAPESKKIHLFETVNISAETKFEENALIAPGSKGAFEIRVENKSEVPIKAVVSLLETNAAGVPIVYGYQGKYYTNVVPVLGKVGGKTIEGNMTKLKNDISDRMTFIAAKEPVKVIPLIWEWAFEANDAQKDEIDTALGLLGTDTVILDIECNIMQV